MPRLSHRLPFLTFVVVALVSVCSVASAGYRAKDDPVVQVAQKLKPSIVMVGVVSEQVVQDWFSGPQVQQQSGLGSGVMFDASGLVLTNNHVVEGATQIQVSLSNGHHYKATVVGTDPQTDLAVIRLEAKGERFVAAELGNSSTVLVGELAIAIGNPLGFDHTVTAGIVSALNRPLPANDKGFRMENLIQTDAAINPGNSGGALVNGEGKVIGINTAIIPNAQGIGFAIPINTAKKVAKQLVEKGRVVRSGLGLTQYGQVTQEIADYYGFTTNYGIFVGQMAKSAPLYKAGLRMRDIIVKVKGRKIEEIADILAAIDAVKVGGTVDVTYVRGKVTKTVSVTTQERPASQ